MIHKRGFTLIELLVVVAIIAVLSVIGLTIFTGVQKGARDARRKSDMEAISKALEVNYNNSSCGASTSSPYCNVNSYPTVLFSSGSVPSNPSPGGAAYSGIPSAAGSTYTVCANLETSTGNYNDAGSSANSTNTGSYYCRKNQQ